MSDDPQASTNDQPPYRSWEERVSAIDRRWIYMLLFLVTLAPLVFRWQLPLYVTQDARDLHQVIEGLKPDRIVILCCNWDSGTIAENRPQTVALARHLLRRHLPFAILSIAYATSPQLAPAS